MTALRAIAEFLAREPIAVSEFIRSAVIMLVVFNAVSMTEDQFGALMAALGAFLGLLARAGSTPNSKIGE